MSSPESNPSRHISADKRLRQITGFNECSSSFLQALSRELQEEIFQSGEVLIQEGDIGHYMYVLDIGVVDVKVGKNHVATLNDGLLLGGLAITSSEPDATQQIASIIAKTVCVCWYINPRVLHKIMTDYPKDRAIISSCAGERLAGLVSKGLVPERSAERGVGHAKPKLRKHPQGSFLGRTLKLSQVLS